MVRGGGGGVGWGGMKDESCVGDTLTVDFKVDRKLLTAVSDLP